MGVLTILDEQFIRYWKQLNFQDWNEQDVREEFIAPLLKILGYAKGTVNSVLREKSLNLSEKYHMIGRKQIAIDYVPTIRLKKFWIIEAKPSNPIEMDFGDFLQAHLYAIHPEINARFIVMTNGWELRVYDALLSNDWSDYIFVCKQSDCETTFSQLKEFLSSSSITTSIRKYILSTINDSLKVEVDQKQAELLRQEMNVLCNEALPIIRRNAADLQTQYWQ